MSRSIRRTLTTGPVTNLAQDFGYSPNDGIGNEGLIGDTIFFDANGNGVADPGEGLPGVKVTLDGTTVTYTDANGNYYFAGLAAGAHTVVVDPATLPAGLTNTVDPDGGTANQATVTLATNDSVNLDQDFGYQATTLQTSAIGDTIWLDVDRDGVRGCGRARHPRRDRGPDPGPGRRRRLGRGRADHRHRHHRRQRQPTSSLVCPPPMARARTTTWCG